MPPMCPDILISIINKKTMIYLYLSV
uniref:Uncharacterized protein n=1 Tax=Anguilla anguilla TaxID=7936 RepID=A0A0E9XTS2_ANGAN